MEVKWKSSTKEEDLGLYAVLLRGFNMEGGRAPERRPRRHRLQLCILGLRGSALQPASRFTENSFADQVDQILKNQCDIFSEIGWWISSDWSGSLESDQLILREPSWLICSDWSVTSSGRFAWEIACSNWLRVSSSKDVSPTWKEQLWSNSVQGNRDQNIES